MVDGRPGMYEREEAKRFRAGPKAPPRPKHERGSPAPVERRRPGQDEEERSLDFVQRMIVSALIIVVFGLLAAVLALYVAIYPEESSKGNTIGLWVMTGVIGLVSAAAVLVTNRRRPYSPWVLLGLLPMVISANWVL